MSEPEVALVFSPDRWVEDLHRHCVDHGGARIRCVVMDPAVALDEEYGVLVVSHRWPGLTLGFVEAVHARGRRVLGVLDPTEPAAPRHLETVGVDAVVGTDANMEDFVAAIVEVAPRAGTGSARGGDAAADLDGAPAAGGPGAHPAGSGPLVVGGTAGAGRTEVAIELAHRLGTGAGAGRTVLVDGDEVAPAIAARLGLPIEPNLRTAVDAVEYGLGARPDMAAETQRGGFSTVSGLPNVGAWSQLRPGEVLDVVAALRAAFDQVVVDVGPSLEDVPVAGRGRYAVTRELVAQAGVLVGVGGATPVGLIRLLAWAVEARTLNPVAPLHLVVTRAPNDAFRRGEITEEITRTFPATSLSFVPTDRRVERASWEGTLVAAGPFTKAVAALATVVCPAPVPRRGRRHRSFLARKSSIYAPQRAKNAGVPA